MMRCFHVTFHCVEEVLYTPHSGGRDIVHAFYVDNTQDLSEQIMEYQEDLEEDYIVVSKDIREVKCD